MTKKSNKPLIIGGAAVILIVIFSWFFAKGPSGEYSEDIKAYFDALNAEGLNTIETIDRALANKTIDSETALVYKVYAVFGDELLPEEYYTQKPYREGTPLVKEMNHRWDELSAETKALLEPYRKRPEEEGSWMNVRFADSLSNAETNWLIPNAYAERKSAYTEFLLSKDEKVKIWYPSVTGMMRNTNSPDNTMVDAPTGKKIAQKIKGFLDGDEIIADFEDLLGGKQLMSDGTKGGDSKYDIYVAPCGGDWGLTYSEGATPAPGYIIMNYNIGLKRDNLLKTTLAHELFHAFQYTYGYDDKKDNWWGEATAVWSEDYIYPHVNSEHGWLKRFLWFPGTQADKETPPSSHHYAAYIMAYFMTENFGDDFMRKSWEYCDGNKCIDGIDKNIDGGFKKQWKEFTLWNYNLDPANYYMDMGPFPPISSLASGDTEAVFAGEGTTEYEIQKINPLAADLANVSYELPDDTKVKKLTFKDLKKFTDKSDKTGIKAVIYFKDGKKKVEDWTDLGKRSFCIENKEEDFKNIVLIFSNGATEEEVDATTLNVKSSNSCFEIDEKESRTAVIHFPYSDGGALKTININTTIDAVAEGEPEEDAPEDATFAYQTKWKMKYEFEQVKDAFSASCAGSSFNYEAGWTTRAAGYLLFDLNPKSDGYGEGDTFPIDMQYGEIHPNGPYEDVPNVNVNCAGISFGSSKIDLSSYKGVVKGIYTGKITEMTPNGAKIEIENCCLYHSCTTQQGAPFQDISEPVILKIKRMGS
ncbi:hypothetical protein KKA33_02755 [Patescibacteria group bacterium]|nr:hypothetical protein [Patescibacteria group bacterium]